MLSSTWYVARMTTTLESTRHLRRAVETSASPPKGALEGIETLELLITAMLANEPMVAMMVTKDVVRDPKAAEAVIAMAVGALASVEKSFQSAAKTLSGLESDSPEAVRAIATQLAEQFGVPVEDIDLTHGR